MATEPFAAGSPSKAITAEGRNTVEVTCSILRLTRPAGHVCLTTWRSAAALTIPTPIAMTSFRLKPEATGGKKSRPKKKGRV